MRAATFHAIQTILHRIRFAVTACDKMLSYWHSTINTTTTTFVTTSTTTAAAAATFTAITACDKILSYWHSTINTITTSATTTITVTLVSMHGGKVNLISY